MTSPVVYVTSSACHGAGNCVAAGLLPSGDVVVRDTKTGGELVFTADEWVAFVRGVKDGEFDLGSLAAAPEITAPRIDRAARIDELKRLVTEINQNILDLHPPNEDIATGMACVLDGLHERIAELEGQGDG